MWQQRYDILTSLSYDAVLTNLHTKDVHLNEGMTQNTSCRSYCGSVTELPEGGCAKRIKTREDGLGTRNEESELMERLRTSCLSYTEVIV